MNIATELILRAAALAVRQGVPREVVAQHLREIAAKIETQPVMGE